MIKQWNLTWLEWDLWLIYVYSNMLGIIESSVQIKRTKHICVWKYNSIMTHTIVNWNEWKRNDWMERNGMVRFDFGCGTYKSSNIKCKEWRFSTLQQTFSMYINLGIVTFILCSRYHDVSEWNWLGWKLSEKPHTVTNTLLIVCAIWPYIYFISYSFSHTI